MIFNEFRIKNIFLQALLLLLAASSLIYGRERTVVTSAYSSASGMIGKEKINEITIIPRDSVTFYFAVEEVTEGEEDIQYRVFLNGRLFEAGLKSAQHNFVSFGGLDEGEYVLKAQAYVPGRWDADPVVLRFIVGEKKERTKAGIISEETGDNGGNIIMYVLVAVCILQFAVIIFLLLRKGKLQAPKAYDGDKFADLEYSYNKLKREYDALKNTPSRQEEDPELRNAYERLKREYGTLKETNGFLKQQIAGLKTYISDLETANVQLGQQKEKLLESKRQLEELQRQKDELYAIAIHDIKNPAAAIKGYVELLESYDLNANEQQEIMQSLANTSSRIIDLAQKMSLAVAQQQPEPVVQMDNASLKQITDDICKRNMAYANKKNVKLINNTSPNTPVTKLDPFRIEEAVDNLINNAIKYAPEETVVQVRTYFSDKSITLEVIDNGVGLSETECSQVFEKGALLSPKPTGGETRSGLGLWIVKKIIEEHGGRVWVKSKKGVGSTFGFELPVRQK